MRSFFLSFVVLGFVCSGASGGGPDLRCKSAMVESVVADESKIILIISGRCELFLSDSKLPPGEGTVRFVASDLDHCVVTLVRRKEALEGMGFKSWQECCDKSTALREKEAWLDLQGAVTIESAMVVSVGATSYGFAAPQAATNKPVTQPIPEKKREDRR